MLEDAKILKKRAELKKLTLEWRKKYNLGGKEVSRNA